MRTLRKFHRYGSTAALIMTAALSIASSAQMRVPFKGSLQGADSDNFISSTNLIVTSTGTGTATHLGRFSYTLISNVDLTTSTETAVAVFTAANGDTITASVIGSGAPTDNPGMISISETFTITGGTGRFEGAQGSFTAQRIGNGITFTTTGTFEGSITSPGALH